jgi:hypothetical protein
MTSLSRRTVVVNQAIQLIQESDTGNNIGRMNQYPRDDFYDGTTGRSEFGAEKRGLEPQTETHPKSAVA